MTEGGQKRKEINQEFLPRHHWGLLIRCQKLWKLSGEALSIYALQIKTWRFTPSTSAGDTDIRHRATFGSPWTTTSHWHLHENLTLIFKKEYKMYHKLECTLESLWFSRGLCSWMFPQDKFNNYKHQISKR